MSEPLIDNPLADFQKLAAELREMAARLEMNGPEQFGGCFVIIPPSGGDVVKTLVIDRNQDIAQFWGILQTKARIALESLDTQQRQAGWR
jgi:hypothetical protein